MPSQEDYARTARKSCLPCRRSKRRCDKKFPSCDLCIRKEVECRYPHAELPASNSHYHHKSTPTESNATAIYFIAPQVFHQARLELPRFDVPIPFDVACLIGDDDNIRNIATTFFRSVHTWMPIISKRIFFTHLLNPLARRHNELSLLAVCMLLCSKTSLGLNGSSDAKSAIYQTAKAYYLKVEAARALSIHILQAAVLIAVYEVGQAIYPAAYLTIGACARYGCMLGIDKLGLDLMGESLGLLTWIEVEERRRLWWAVLLLDRFMNLSNPKRHLVTEDPTFDTYLPVDDKAWDDCTTKPSDAVVISNGLTLKMGIFSRTAQATYLLSEALKSVPPRVNYQDKTAHANQVMQLRRTLLALVHLADTEATVRRLEFCTPSSICFSAILLLQQHDWQISGTGASGDQEVPWDETRIALSRLSEAAVSYHANCQNSPESTERVSFFLTYVMYRAASVLIRLGRRRPRGETEEEIETSKQLLRSINKRWQLAGIYLTILEAEEITTASEVI